MQPVSGKKAMLMGIYEVLRRYSDVEHPLSVKFIIEKLQKEYGMEAERKAVGNNIRVLLELGYDISSYQENRKGYYLREREFDDVELRILIDSVADNRCLPQNDARRLVRKLMDLSNVYFADQCRSLSNADYANHQEHKEFFFNLEQLERSIRKNQRVSFIYNQYGTDGKLHPVAGDAFIVRPSRILHKDMRYYLLAEKAEGQETFCFRLDCMTSLAVLEEEKAELGRRRQKSPPPEAWAAVSLCAPAADGREKLSILRMDQRFAGDVADYFGTEATMHEIAGHKMEIRIRALFGKVWRFIWTYGAQCEVLWPRQLRRKVREELEDMLRLYQAGE